MEASRSFLSIKSHWRVSCKSQNGISDFAATLPADERLLDRAIKAFCEGNRSPPTISAAGYPQRTTSPCRPPIQSIDAPLSLQSA